MSLLTTILYLLDEADVDGYEVSVENADITVDGDAFWKEMEREGLKVREPRTAFGFRLHLKEGFGKVSLSVLDYDQTFSRPVSEWHTEADGDDTLKQLTWKRYKLLPENMKDDWKRYKLLPENMKDDWKRYKTLPESMKYDLWPARINGAETLQQMTDVFDKVSKMWRVAQWRKRLGVA